MAQTVAEPTLAEPTLTRKDFVSDQEVRWCPGCGDYAVLAQMQRVLPEIGVPRENIVFISGIGCSSRFPYYMDTYGIHSIHGRAPTLATGLKAANPDLSVWVVTGDGDGLSIGGNHLLHCMRRNMDIKIILFNNRIYGLTKGQYSPTSPLGHRTKSAPQGSIDHSFNPLSVALGAEATFVARTQDNQIHHMREVLRRAAEHKGTAFVEVYQSCVVFYDDAWKHTSDSGERDDNTLYLEDGKPLVFGKNRDRGIRMNGLEPEVVELGNGTTEEDLLHHTETFLLRSYAYMLSRMNYPRFPAPFGVFWKLDKPVYTDMLLEQEEKAIAQKGKGELAALYRGNDAWEVE
jgi:2-oxoglutarate/2-oxoacid ferredoxin oxidoreductase subunit beta